MPQKEALVLRQKINGVVLRRARQKADKSLKQCGQILGISASAMGAIEHGRRPISLPELEVLAYYLDVPVERLLNGEDVPGTERRSVDELPLEELMTLRHRIIGVVLRRARLSQGLGLDQLAEAAELPADAVAEYESGETPIPVSQLVVLAETLQLPVDHFLEKDVGPIGQARQLVQDAAHLDHLPADVRDFVLEPGHMDYLRLAMSLSEMPAGRLRGIAASLLDITL
jgi:transcriptional regulator with XRE-family HTH domain